MGAADDCSERHAPLNRVHRGECEQESSHEQTLAKVGKQLGVTRGRVCKIETQPLHRLRRSQTLLSFRKD